jgi:periplasmic protein TonB
MAVYVQRNNPHRVTVLAIIIGFHVLMGVGLVTGLAQKAVQLIAPPIQTDLIEEIQQEDRPPPPPPPQMERPPVQVPPPDVVIDIPIQQATNTISNVTDKPVPRVVAPPPPKVVVAAKIRRMPSSEDYYPAASKRAEEQGSVVVRVCVDAGGRLIGDPTVVTSSGYSRLDAGAVRLAKAGRYQAGTSDGQAQSESCVSFRVKFEIK